MARDTAGRRGAIEKSLLDYQHSPGKYALVGRQPSLLFASVKEVLQLASGRSPNGDDTAGPEAEVRQAACFFIRSALLYPAADHYALLGLDRNAEATAVKERYRLMMRLMHPDFYSALSSANWPTDAASRVNQAYEVLSSPVQRRAYDNQLDPPAPVPDRKPNSPVAGAARTVAGDHRHGLKLLATLFGTAGGLALLAVWLSGGPADRENLVQRHAANAELVINTALPEPAIPPSAPALAVPTQDMEAAPERPNALTPKPAVQHGTVDPTTQVAVTLPVKPDAPLRPEPVEPPYAPPSAMRVVAPAPQASPPPALLIQAVAQPAPAAKQPPHAGPTLADAHPLLSRLLQELESGWGDRVLSPLDREARAAPGAQALLQRYDEMVDGMRPVRLSNVQFKAESRDGRLVVTGRVLMQVRDRAAVPRELGVQAEFAFRDGAVVMTRLAQE